MLGMVLVFSPGDEGRSNVFFFFLICCCQASLDGGIVDQDVDHEACSGSVSMTEPLTNIVVSTLTPDPLCVGIVTLGGPVPGRLPFVGISTISGSI